MGKSCLVVSCNVLRIGDRNRKNKNSNDLKEDVALARMIEETECDENDDVEAQSSSTEITLVEHTVLSNAITNTTEISNDSTNTTIKSPTIMNTILTNGESYENKNQKNINNGSLVQNDAMLQSMVVDQGTFIIEDDDEKKTKKHSKKKKKKKKKHKDTNVEISSDNGDENANDDA